MLIFSLLDDVVAMDVLPKILWNVSPKYWKIRVFRFGMKMTRTLIDGFTWNILKNYGL